MTARACATSASAPAASRRSAISAAAGAGSTIDCRGLHILPGVIDSQVHFREPGLEHKEDLESGSRAAVLGGVTAVFEMPNTSPLTTSAETLADKVRRGPHRMHCDFAFWVGGTRDNAGDVGELERLPGAAGIKVFMGSSTGDLLVEDDEGVASILRNTRRRAAFHSEDEYRLRERLGLRVAGDASSHPVWRDEIAALRSTQRLVAHRAAGAGAHPRAAHLDGRGDRLPRRPQGCRDLRGDAASPDADGRRLCAARHAAADEPAGARSAPPRRHLARRRRRASSTCSAPTTPRTRWRRRQSPIRPRRPGMTGVQTLVPIMLDHVNAGRLTLQRFVDLSSHGPQRIFGMARKGRIAAGYDADFTVVDLKRRETITNAQAGSKAGWTPYDGKQVTGWPVGTIVRGNARDVGGRDRRGRARASRCCFRRRCRVAAERLPP